MLHRYTLLVLFLLYAVLLFQFFREKNRVAGANWVAAAMAIWPLILLDEIIRVFDLPLAAVSSVVVFAPLLCLTLLYRSVKLLVIDNPPASKPLLWLPVAIAVVAQAPLWFVSVSEKSVWLQASPVGHPLDNWALYLAYMITGFGMLVMGIVITEMIQNYHRHLSCQVVDVREYKVRWLGGAMGITVGLGFCCVLLVTAGAFGFFNITFWQSLFNVLFAIAMLQTFIAVIRPQHTSPSPLNYRRLDELKAQQCVMREALVKAEQAMSSMEAYKTPGLQLKAFAKDCDADPTTLIIALRLLEKRDFRSFVYQYRLAYAKSELISQDSQLAATAKRLGIHSEQFLSGAMMGHIRRQKSAAPAE